MHDLLVLLGIANIPQAPGADSSLRGLRLLMMCREQYRVYVPNVVTFGSVNELLSSTLVDISGCQSHLFKIMPYLDAM
jgi:hypothetical protein